MNIKRSVRLTRRSYRRKLIMFGVSIFMSLALVATGFAAWVLSNDATKEESGAVEIAAVHEESVEISEIEFIADNDKQTAPKNFTFEPLESDTYGRVRYDGKSNPENLDVKFQWSIDNYQIVGKIFIDFKVPANVYTAIERGWLYIDRQNPESSDTTGFEVIGDETKDGKNYKVLRYVVQGGQGEITADKTSPDGVVDYKVVDKTGDVVNKVTFTMNIAFKWGEAFDEMNPGIYYDTPPAQDNPAPDEYGANIDYDEVKKTLNEFKATLHGLHLLENFDIDEFNDLPEVVKEEDYYDKNPIPNYIIVINAQVA